MNDQFPDIKSQDAPDLEEEILDFWESEQIFARSIAGREDAPAFTFYEGPPTANGSPGIHHVMGRTIKDVFCRYRTMKGYRVERRAGWDTHGLPVEIEVEKELDLEGRHEVEAYGVDRYNEACRESVLAYKDEWDRLTRRIGYWVDLDDPYVTFETDYVETLWWLIKQIHEKGLLYKGYKIQWYSPGSETVLSSHEVSLGYEEVQDPSVYVRFPVQGEENTHLLAWTTTPWTLISNTALAVGPDLTYVKIRHEDPHRGTEDLILAEDRLEVIHEEAEVLERYVGRDLLGLSYEPLYSYFEDEVEDGNAWYVVEGEFVDTEDGTGVVHLAPAFGEEDHRVGAREGLPLFNPVTTDGRFTDRADLVAGKWFKDADDPIVEDLKHRGRLYRRESHTHNYPHDWRKGTPLMNYPVESWFVETTALKDRMIELNETINWKPPGIGEGRFGEWLENNVDWALSRNRYWGTPLPVWESDAEGSDYREVIGSIGELREKCGDQLPEDEEEIDLHRPYVDELTWEAPDGGTMRRVEELVDVWFDSGAMPFAQWHYPFENEDTFAANFPADFIAEGVDQTRGWFYTLHAIAAIVRDDVAFENVVVNGLLLDESGEKMSKSKGNTVEPFEAIAEHGVDPLRWFMMSNSQPWDNHKWSERELRDTERTFFGTLLNTYAFFRTYANVDAFTYAADRLPAGERCELDRWILSRLHRTTAKVDERYEDYDATGAARAVERFVDDLSNWYVRRSRRRFWKSEHGTEKEAAFQTVYECLVAVAKMMAPIAPFYGDALFRALETTSDGPAPDSVHLDDFPRPREEEVDEDLERRMHLARTISSVVLSLRNEEEINVRQPLPRILVVTGTAVDGADVDRVGALIRDEVNVKTIEYVESSSGLVEKSAKPDFARLGSRLGSLMKPVNERVRALGTAEIEEFEREGGMTLEVDGETVELERDDLIVTSEGIEGWRVGQEEGITVALDTTITDELRAEGTAREFVNRVQRLRKQIDYEISDRVALRYEAPEAIREAVRRHEDWIRNETLAVKLEDARDGTGRAQIDQTSFDAEETFDLGGETVTFWIRVATDAEKATSSTP